MQEYYYLKLKYILRALLAGSLLVVGSICVIISIAKEMHDLYKPSLSNAYMAGLGICIILLLAGLVCLFRAFHFEKNMPGNKKDNFELLKKDLEAGRCVGGTDVLVSDHFLISLSPASIRGCRVIPASRLIACFEEGRAVQADGSLRLTFYDDRFTVYDILLEGDDAENGHAFIQTLYSRMPWIFSKGREDFQDKTSSRKGRARLLTELKHRREDALQSQDDSTEEITPLPEENTPHPAEEVTPHPAGETEVLHTEETTALHTEVTTLLSDEEITPHPVEDITSRPADPSDPAGAESSARDQPIHPQ